MSSAFSSTGYERYLLHSHADWFHLDEGQRTSTMLPVTSHENQQIRLKTFRNDVLGSAFEFAVALQTSATAYGFSEPTTDKTRFKS